MKRKNYFNAEINERNHDFMLSARVEAEKSKKS